MKADIVAVEIVINLFLIIGETIDQAGVIHLKRIETGGVENSVMEESKVSDLMGEAINLNVPLNAEKINHLILANQKEIRAIKEIGARRNGMISPLTNRMS